MPRPVSPTLLATTLRKLPDFAQSIGVDIVPLATSIGLDPTVFSDRSQRISLEAVGRLFALLHTVSGDDSVGLKFGEFYDLGDSGPLGFAIINAPDLRTALGTYVRFHSVIYNQMVISATTDDHDYIMEWKLSSYFTHPEHVVDMRIAIISRVIRLFIGPHWLAKTVELRRAQPRSTALHRKLLSPRVLFGQSRNQLAMPLSSLDTVNPSGDPRLYEIMQATCEAQLSEVATTGDIALRAKQIVTGHLQGGNVTIQKVAAGLALQVLGIEFLGIENALQQAETVAQVNEHAAAVIAIAVDPAADRDRFANVCGAQFAAGMSSKQRCNPDV